MEQPPLTAPQKIQTDDSMLLLQGTVGFFFAFRICITFLWFQSDPQLGTEISMALNLLLLLAALVCSIGDPRTASLSVLRIPVLRWMAGFLAFSCISLAWSEAQSTMVSAAYWVGMTADVLTTVLLIRTDDTERCVAALMKGFCVGATVVALVAWCAPTLPDLRIGSLDFMHPNGLGLEFAIAALFAQYLARENAPWKWPGIALAVTLLRTLSKTSIIAFVAAEIFYLLYDSKMGRRTKIWIGVFASLAIASFWGLLEQYLEMYSTTADQAETLTGRTTIWAVAFAMAMEKPWLGHGIYSFRALIPAFGTFEPWHAHNELLQQFFEYGLAGVVLVIGLYWIFFLQAKRASSGSLKTLALALLMYALIRGLTDTVNFGLSYPLWLLTALALSLAPTGSSSASPVPQTI